MGFERAGNRVRTDDLLTLPLHFLFLTQVDALLNAIEPLLDFGRRGLPELWRERKGGRVSAGSAKSSGFSGLVFILGGCW